LATTDEQAKKIFIRTHLKKVFRGGERQKNIIFYLKVYALFLNKYITLLLSMLLRNWNDDDEERGRRE